MASTNGRKCAICLLRQVQRSSSASIIARSSLTSTNIPSSSGSNRPQYRSFTSTPPDQRSAIARSFSLNEVLPRKPREPQRHGKHVAPATFTLDDFQPTAAPTASQVCRLIVHRIDEWATSERTMDKLSAYRLKAHQAEKALSAWMSDVHSELSQATTDAAASEALKQGQWDVDRLIDGLASDGWAEVFESAMLRHFLSYASTSSSLPAAARAHISEILSITDLTQIAYSNHNIPARSISRQFHLHVGPTNSGKTYSALKALSRAGTGVYAGPLRLLAHEVWERLNLGTVGDLNGEGRECNLLTGEERRIVSEDAGLVSCTVEMIPTTAVGGEPWDVVVIDEIQMLGDAQRGGAWTNAVLGVKARQVHLCGDETTVQLLSSLIPTLGDTVQVHRYNRLTPLQVADTSLESDWNKIEKGDCVVTFSRTNIFSVKKQIESIAGKKCAVVYGALPPETRAEQAKDFNEGRAEVLVASDAVGMGLNLKIKRMIFESLHKFNGKTEVPLPLTQVKQIAGRAGRFGMHKKEADSDSSSDKEPRLDADRDPSVIPPADSNTATTNAPGGSVTTLHKVDLPLLRGLLPLPLPSIARAAFDIPRHIIDHLAQIFPSDVTFSQLQTHASALALLPAHMRAVDLQGRLKVSELLEPYRQKLTMDDLMLLSMAPVNVRDPIAVSVYTNLVGAYVNSGMVEVVEILKPSGMIRTLENVELTLSTLPPMPPIEGVGRRPLVPPILVSSIPQLETLHKSLVAYIWLSFRLSIAFPDRPLAQSLKERVENVLEECLKRLPGLRQRKTSERGKEVDGLVAKWRREHVEPNGRKKGWDRYTFEQKVAEMEAEERERGKLIQWRGNKVRGGSKGTGIWSRIGHIRSKV